LSRVDAAASARVERWRSPAELRGRFVAVDWRWAAG
jgi:hypothetical protein